MAGFAVDKLLRTIPRFKPLFSRRLTLYKISFFFLGKKVIAIINRLVSHSYFWRTTKWSIMTFNRDIFGIYQIAVDIIDYLRSI